MNSNININEDRLWQSLNKMATIGATPKGGGNRQTLTDLDKESRDLFIKWCKQENLTIKIDQIGMARDCGSPMAHEPLWFRKKWSEILRFSLMNGHQSEWSWLDSKK